MRDCASRERQIIGGFITLSLHGSFGRRKKKEKNKKVTPSRNQGWLECIASDAAPSSIRLANETATPEAASLPALLLPVAARKTSRASRGLCFLPSTLRAVPCCCCQAWLPPTHE